MLPIPSKIGVIVIEFIIVFVVLLLNFVITYLNLPCAVLGKYILFSKYQMLLNWFFDKQNMK